MREKLGNFVKVPRRSRDNENGLTRYFPHESKTGKISRNDRFLKREKTYDFLVGFRRKLAINSPENSLPGGEICNYVYDNESGEDVGTTISRLPWQDDLSDISFKIEFTA